MTLYYALGFLIAILVIIFFFSRIKMIFSFIVFFIFLMLLRTGVFIVNEGTQAVITQFGSIVGKPYTTAGLYFKIPLLWKVNYLDKRIYTEPEYEADITTKDGYFITLDTVFNWQITNGAVFLETMNNIDTAKAFLRNITSGSVRQIISEHNLLETIRSKNIDYQDKFVLDGMTRKERKILGMDDKIVLGRSRLSIEMVNSINRYLKQYGIHVVGVLIRNIKYEPTVEKIIYSRMITEKLREAEKLRSTGRSEALRIRGELKRTYSSIISPANRKATLIIGEAEAIATRIQARAYDRDRDFYNYWRTLRVYKDNLPKQSQGIFLGGDSPILQWLVSGSYIKQDTDIATHENTSVHANHEQPTPTASSINIKAFKKEAIFAPLSLKKLSEQPENPKK